ncbi:hypothetical protein D6D01_05879 [Aureobasidium pullulans]|uniref:Uncharacterized protein n=1 Tax=Aureobasidium pullulans TaxID=5580 RepID=A0A4S9L4D5_AURPU|nr:hypothetical protein D6D01_05879 [Aureobasidium pullulans]
MALPTTANWTARINTIVVLFNDERFLMAEKEARMLLRYLELSQYFRLRSLILFAQSVESWYDSKYYRDAAEDMWYTMRRMWPTKITVSNENIVMDKLRRFLDEPNEDILEDRSGNCYNPDGLIEYESIFLDAFKKVTGDDHSVASADTNKQDESDSTLHLGDFHKLFAANKSVAGVDQIESQTETIVTSKSSPDTLKIDGNMIEEANAQLDKDKIDDLQFIGLSNQEEATIFDDIPSKKRKAADRFSAEANKVQDVLSSQHKSYTEPSKQDAATVLDDPASNKRMKND